MVENLDRHLRIAAELPRQRPFGAGTAEQKAAEDLGAGGGASDLFHLCLAVDREQTDAERESARDVTFLLDRIAEGDALGRGAGGEHHLDLGDRGGVEAGAKRDQERQQFRRRVRLDGIKHPAVRQRLGKGAIVVAHDVEIDDEARTIVQAVFAAAAQEVVDALGHWSRSFIQVQGAKLAGPALKFGRTRFCAHDRRQRLQRFGGRPCVGDTVRTRGACAEMLPWIGAGEPVPHGRQDKMDKPLRC